MEAAGATSAEAKIFRPETGIGSESPVTDQLDPSQVRLPSGKSSGAPAS